MKKMFLIIILSILFIAILFFGGCKVGYPSETWAQPNYWVGTYSEIITRTYSPTEVEFSPTGENVVQFRILLKISEDGTAYFSRKILNSDYTNLNLNHYATVTFEAYDQSNLFSSDRSEPNKNSDEKYIKVLIYIRYKDVEGKDYTAATFGIAEDAHLYYLDIYPHMHYGYYDTYKKSVWYKVY